MSFLIVVPVSGFAMGENQAESLSQSTTQQVKACNSSTCVSKVLKSAKSKMRGMPVLSKTSSALGKVTKVLKKSCKGGCDDAAIAKIKAVASAQSGKLSKSKYDQDKAFSALFNPANFGSQLK